MKSNLTKGLVILITFILSSPAFSLDPNAYFGNNLLLSVSQQYGNKAGRRVEALLSNVAQNSDRSEWVKINRINHFFNKQITYSDDISQWGREEYWASPAETLGTGRGDCEDYAIAKFFGLLSLGVPQQKLRLMYVRQLKVNQPHMVLAYFEHSSAIPLILDNNIDEILPASKRTDLKPIYSFNDYGVWLARDRGMGRRVENSAGVSAWDRLKERMQDKALAYNPYNPYNP